MHINVYPGFRNNSEWPSVPVSSDLEWQNNSNINDRNNDITI